MTLSVLYHYLVYIVLIFGSYHYLVHIFKCYISVKYVVISTN